MNTRFRFPRLVIPLIVLFLAPVACVFTPAKPDAENQANNPNPLQGVSDLLSKEPGQNRKNPIPIGKQISIPGWDVEVREFLRGEDALKVINTADWQADPLPEGKEYALARVFIRNTSLDENSHDLGISEMFMTGDQNRLYGDSMDGWPQPEFLFEDMYTAEAVEGWVDGVVPTAEKNLELVLDVTGDDVRYTRFFALDDGASITLDKDLTGLKPNDVGIKFENPAAAGEKVITQDWELTLVESIRGQEAETILEKDNPNYEAPEAGTERFLIHMKLRYINPYDLPGWVGSSQFMALDDSGYTFQGNNIYTPRNEHWIGEKVLPGAELDGWVAVAGPQGANQVVVEFYPPENGIDSSFQNIRYFAVK
jgi:hypothetical protein